MTVHVDTSLLVDSLTGPLRSTPLLAQAVRRGELLYLSTITLFEWLRGPRSDEERARQEALFPPDRLVSFGPDEARVAARLYRAVRRARSREADIAIAASAIEHGAALWTLNDADFNDIPGLLLYRVS
jgi:predicted nucleic acid-binding protein